MIVILWYTKTQQSQPEEDEKDDDDGMNYADIVDVELSFRGAIWYQY
jgi:hypothetical protein